MFLTARLIRPTIPRSPSPKHALAVTILSAVADRFGICGPPGSANVSWGDWPHFVAYTASLHRSSKGARVSFEGKKRTVTDGPFAETKELVVGFWLWNCASLQEATEWAKRCPNPMRDGSEIEIRRVFEAEDFGPAHTPELREQEERLRAELEQRKGS